MDYAGDKKTISTIDFGPIFFVTPNPNRAVGLEKSIRNYHIICSHYLDIIEYLREDGVPVLCLNDDAIKNTGKLLENEKVLNYIKAQSGGEVPNIITFKPSPKIEKVCELHKFNYVGNDWRLNRKFENKINFVEISGKLNIPNAGSRVVRLGDFEAIRSFFDQGAKCVIQLPRGYSGNSTFLLSGREDFDQLADKFNGRSVKAARYLAGETFTINGCVAGGDVFVGKPIYQITGFTDFNGNKLGTSGNDYVYPEKLSSEAKKKIFDYTRKIGEYMSREGYKGIFGLDFIVPENSKVDLIEINPRLVGSIPVYTKLQIERGEFPFLAMHLGEFIYGKSLADRLPERSYEFWRKGEDFSASQLILRNTGKRTLVLDKAVSSGIYKLEKGKMVFAGKSYFIGARLGRDEVLIQCASQGSLINPDMEYANIQTSYGIMKERGFDEGFSAVVGLVQDRIKLKETA